MLTIQNLDFENYGTGRVLNIVDKGTYTWHVLLINMLNFCFRFLTVGTFIVVRMMIVDVRYGLGALMAFFLVIGWVIWNNTKALKWKTRLKEVESEHTRKLVKMCMSKFEILQNKKMYSEIEYLRQNIANQKIYGSKRSKYLGLMYDTPFFAFLTMIVSVYLLSSLHIFSIPAPAFMEFMGMAILAQSLIFPLVDFIKDFTKEFTHVEKLWDFVDNTPQIE
ncbi:MAG: hypothetical protein WCK88_05220 [bacterium]